jgi:hypothetical protein
MAVGHSKVNVHQAGKDHVLRRLYRLGLPASLAPRGEAAHVQILSSDKRMIAQLLVSARTDRSKGGWVMNEKHEYLSQPRCFYALVDLEPREPVTYIVPSAIVSDRLKKDHAGWLKEDPTHQDNPVRKLVNGPWLNPYREAWALIQEGTAVNV